MGTQEGERDWVDVANDLLSKCHINLRLRKLSDCDASAFLTLYESILGEKVPDFIATPCSQEDDIHNVQSVIDSLSLDYLQISLSHITGENIVRGDKESIKNLLEIFDGLLEYLKEEISEESQDGEELNDSLNQDVPDETKEQTGSEPVGEREAEPERASTSSCGDAEGKGSTNELIGLGISARTFTAEQEAPSSGLLEPHPPPLTEPLHSAVALQPPNQSDTPHRPDADPPTSNQPATAAAASEEQTEEAAPVTDQTSVPVSETVTANGHQTPPPLQPPDPAVSEDPEPGQQRAETETQTEAEALEPTNGGPRRVLFHTQPDVLFLTLQEETAAITPSPPDTEEEEEEDLNYPPAKLDRRRGKTGRSSRSEVQDFEDPLLNRRRRNKKAEEELHHISEKLSHRLEELDQMLKRVLSESGESSDVREEDKLSQLSDGLMESGRQKNTEAEPDSTLQTSSPPSCRPLRSQLGEALAEALGLDDGKQTNLSVSDHTRRKETHVRATQRRHVKSKEKELRRREDEERADVDRARLRAQEAEQLYREAILSDVSQASRSRSSPSRTKSQNRSGRQTSPGRRRHEGHRKTASMMVKENELLPVLLDELPHLHITPHALGRMWEQQMQQVDKLHAMSSSRGQRRSKLSTQVEEAQRKHDLLVEIIRKEQDHKKRLRDFKERIQQQKSTQNRLREQRQQIARAKKYHSDYHVQHRARLMRARTKEERMFRQLFEEGLELQKQQLREQRAHAKEKRLENQRRHQDHIKSLENYYKDQFSLLAEKLAQERQDIQVRKRAQEKALLKMKRELRTRMEREIGELQKIIIQNDEDDYFQELEVQRLRNRVHMASFQHNTSYLH